MVFEQEDRRHSEAMAKIRRRGRLQVSGVAVLTGTGIGLAGLGETYPIAYVPAGAIGLVLIGLLIYLFKTA